ncbi:hypothetical protein [Chimaeribacter californicus]|uniref:hypothetical protein n=1 Tax=Chimaeribacter californicus TaxID=2060067 RepID=UPI0013FCF6E3|nr:hypothetical protein [Chimaeribacter californicus]
MKTTLTFSSGDTSRTAAPAVPQATLPPKRLPWLHQLLQMLGQNFVGAGKRMY